MSRNTLRRRFSHPSLLFWRKFRNPEEMFPASRGEGIIYMRHSVGLPQTMKKPGYVSLHPRHMTLLTIILPQTFVVHLAREHLKVNKSWRSQVKASLSIVYTEVGTHLVGSLLSLISIRQKNGIISLIVMRTTGWLVICYVYFWKTVVVVRSDKVCRIL